jgi:hypothetical protein
MYIYPISFLGLAPFESQFTSCFYISEIRQPFTLVCTFPSLYFDILNGCGEILENFSWFFQLVYQTS